MADTSTIEWTDATLNMLTGCDKVSPGCANCYIQRTPPFRKVGRKFVRGAIPVELHPERLDQALRWRKPRRIFAPSLGDLFHKDVPDWLRDKTFATAALTPQHTWIILTKRPEEMLVYLSRPGIQGFIASEMMALNDGKPFAGYPELQANWAVNKTVSKNDMKLKGRFKVGGSGKVVRT